MLSEVHRFTFKGDHVALSSSNRPLPTPEPPPVCLKDQLPKHPYLQRHQLENCLDVYILPHPHPENSLEVHLEIHAGSTSERTMERGMAHLCEHLLFMGSNCRGKIMNIQGEANAYTDFHHTVYFSSWRGGPSEENKHKQTKFTLDSMRIKLKAALELVQDIFTAPTQFTVDRLSKEKAAVISEASLVNTVHYRKEQALLSHLHGDTVLPLRYPIGDINLLKSWELHHAQAFHARLYRPENASLFIVGDIAAEEAYHMAKEHLGHLRGNPNGELEWLEDSSRWNANTAKRRSKFFPPLMHKWFRNELKSLGNTKGYDRIARDKARLNCDIFLPALKSGKSVNLVDRVHFWRHSLMQRLSFHFLTKGPVRCLNSKDAFKRLICRKLVLQALGLRLSERCRGSDGSFFSVEVTEVESAKEGCRVVSIDADADPAQWEDALRVAVIEARRMSAYGVTKSELKGLLTAYIGSLQRLHLQMLSSSDILHLLMDAAACGHAVMHVQDEKRFALHFARLAMEECRIGSSVLGSQLNSGTVKGKGQDNAVHLNMEKIAHSSDEILSLINEEARHLLSWMNVLACSDGDGAKYNIEGTFGKEDFGVKGKENPVFNSILGPDAISFFFPSSANSSQKILQLPSVSMSSGLQSQLDRTGRYEDIQHFGQETYNSAGYVSSCEANSITDENKQFEDVVFKKVQELMKEAVDPPKRSSKSPETLFDDVELDQLKQGYFDAKLLQPQVDGSNDLEERGTALLRLLIPGGRFSCTIDDTRPSSLRRRTAHFVVGARTMMEGGSLSHWSREQIESFCAQNLIGVLIDVQDEFFSIDLSAPSGAVRDLGGISAQEKAFQLLRMILTSFNFEESAFRRAKHQAISDYRSYTGDLVGFSLGEMMFEMAHKDPRFSAIHPSVVETVDLETSAQIVRRLLEDALAKKTVELSVVGDVQPEEVRELAALYLGGITPKDIMSKSRYSAKNDVAPLLHLPAENYKQKDDLRTEPNVKSSVLSFGIANASQRTSISTERILNGVNYFENPIPKELLKTPFDWRNGSFGYNFSDDYIYDIDNTKVAVNGRMIRVDIKDSEERAVVHLGGFCCNRWGRFSDRSLLWERMELLEYSKQTQSAIPGSLGGSSQDKEYRKHPVFARLTLALVQELMTKRLFSVLREEKRLTYEASFDFFCPDVLYGGIFSVTVHTQPNDVLRVQKAAKDAIRDAASVRPFLEHQLEAAKQDISSKHQHGKKFGRYWLDLVGGMQLQSQDERKAFLNDYDEVLEKISIDDLQLVLECLPMGSKQLWTSVAIAAPP